MPVTYQPRNGSTRWGVSTVGLEWPKGRDTDYVENARIGSERRFGVELEYNDCPHYPDLQDKTIFGCKYDGSVNGCEFVSPILCGDKGFTEIDNFCQFATLNGFDDSDGAGYHAHFDVSALNNKKLFGIALAYHNTRPFWINTVGEYRRRSTYCSKHSYSKGMVFGKEAWRDFSDFSEDFDRYAWVNFNSYHKYGTVELRLHESTVNADLVKNWIVSHVRFIDAVSDMSVTKINRVFGNSDLSALWREIRTIVKEPNAVSYLRNRFNSNAPVGTVQLS